MKNKALRVAGAVFALVALTHLSRLFLKFGIIIGRHEVPLWANAVGFLIASALSWWMFRAARKSLS